jgi:hypothetical protein
MLPFFETQHRGISFAGFVVAQAVHCFDSDTVASLRNNVPSKLGNATVFVKGPRGSYSYNCAEGEDALDVGAFRHQSNAQVKHLTGVERNGKRMQQSKIRFEEMTRANNFSIL